MAETVNQETKTTTPEPENKTFTQDEVNSYVAERLARERKKYEGIDLDSLKKKAAEFDKLEEARKTDLEKANDTITALQTELDGLKKSAELREIREKVSKDTGIPVNLLTGDTEELCRAQAEGIKAFAMPNAYPTVKDGGEPMHKSGITARDEFAKFAAQILN